jgi:tripartite-type tricarboxylate transporter receptor subunit TctC
MTLGRRQFLQLAAAASALPPLPALAQSYPAKQVRVVLPVAGGGLNDIATRLIAQNLSERLGQTFYIDAQPGAGGNIAMAAVLRAPADGYTILSAAASFALNPALYAKVPYDPFRDFTPVTLMCATAQVIAVHPSLPARTLAELIATVKGNPGKYAYASAGAAAHLAGENLKLAFGLDMTHVPFAGGGQAMTSILGGHTPIGFLALPAVAQNVKAGKVRALAVLSERRSSVLPEVPTMAEAGAPDQEADLMTGMVVRAGTPPAIIELLHRETVKTLALPAVRDRLTGLGFEIVGSTPEKFGDWIKREVAKWQKVVREARIRIE